MNYWQQVFAEWHKSTMNGGVISFIAVWILVMFGPNILPDSVVMFLLCFIIAWLPMLLVLDMLYVAVMRVLEE